jgi:hypothetical protein
MFFWEAWWNRRGTGMGTVCEAAEVNAPNACPIGFPTPIRSPTFSWPNLRFSAYSRSEDNTTICDLMFPHISVRSKCTSSDQDPVIRYRSSAPIWLLII